MRLIAVTGSAGPRTSWTPLVEVTDSGRCKSDVRFDNALRRSTKVEHMHLILEVQVVRSLS